MSNISIHNSPLPAMSLEGIEKVSRLESALLELPQNTLTTHHVIHGGMYSRTIMIPAGVVLTGALIKIPTMVIVSGDVTIYIDGDALELHGYNVLPGSAGRKQVFVAETDTWVTMLFPTDKVTVPEIEAQFTDETDLLASNGELCKNIITITGE